MTLQAPAYFRAVAIDYDGTLADGQVKPDTLTALAEARARRIRVIVVTGRIMSELQAVFPDARDHVDAIVAENGAVLATRAGVRLLAAPDREFVDLTAAVAGMPRADIARLLDGPRPGGSRARPPVLLPD